MSYSHTHSDWKEVLIVFIILVNTTLYQRWVPLPILTKDFTLIIVDIGRLKLLLHKESDCKLYRGNNMCMIGKWSPSGIRTVRVSYWVKLGGFPRMWTVLIDWPDGQMEKCITRGCVWDGKRYGIHPQLIVKLMKSNCTLKKL